MEQCTIYEAVTAGKTSDAHVVSREAWALARRGALAARRAIRDAAGARRHRPIVVVAGAEPPATTGKSGGWYTLGGTPIMYASAYRKKGWSNMTYVCSSRRVSVGADWLRALALVGGAA